MKQAPVSNSEAGFQPSHLASGQPNVIGPAVDQSQGPASFPLILPLCRLPTVFVRHGYRDSLAEDEDNFSIDLDNEAVLREKQSLSKVLDRVAEFVG